MSNEVPWKESAVVSYYAELADIQPPEETLIKLLSNNLSEKYMLDIGVGGGRTTNYFAKLVKIYVGTDYSGEMIDACKKRFSNYSNKISFKVCDARSMSIFNENTFDLILFSYNGIDYISHNDRLKVFREVQRVGKPGSFFFFSTHNILHAHKIFEVKNYLSLHPRILKKLCHWFLLRYMHNRGLDIAQLRNSRYKIINDGIHNFKFRTYYINPIEQIRQLNETDFFKDTRVYSLVSGGEITSETALEKIEDAWLYYLCVIK